MEVKKSLNKYGFDIDVAKVIKASALRVLTVKGVKERAIRKLMKILRTGSNV